MGGNEREPEEPPPTAPLLIVFSYHHQNTEKVALAMARVLGARVTTPRQVRPEELRGRVLLGFGSGIYGGRHHPSVLDLAGALPRVGNARALIFSTCGAPEIGFTEEAVRENHSLLRERLRSRGYAVVDEFSCPGWNTNSFLRFFGGINKGRPNAGDLARAEEFARGLKGR